MNTLKAIIIDDEPLAHNVILKYESEIPFLEIVDQFYRATDAYEILSKQKIDFMLLDINMPVLKGLDFLRTLDHKPEVIITSAYEEYALEGFELQVTDYLLKPFRFERFLKAVNLVRSKISKNQNSPENIFIKVDKKQIQLRLCEIQYLESYGNYVKVWTQDQFYLTPRTLSSFEKELDHKFQRIHKSYIVQKTFIKHVEGNMITLRNGNTITIGKSYRSIVKDLF
ncbi:MAG: LytTR family DNA-binding domain-containing protein [Bacteroidota bacterium]